MTTREGVCILEKMTNNKARLVVIATKAPRKASSGGAMWREVFSIKELHTSSSQSMVLGDLAFLTQGGLNEKAKERGAFMES